MELLTAIIFAAALGVLALLNRIGKAIDANRMATDRAVALLDAIDARLTLLLKNRP